MNEGVCVAKERCDRVAKDEGVRVAKDGGDHFAKDGEDHFARNIEKRLPWREDVLCIFYIGEFFLLFIVLKKLYYKIENNHVEKFGSIFLKA